jgi:hypothetical protein
MAGGGRRRLSARDLNRATLARQLLLAREPLPAAEGVRRVLALQAQEPVGPYLALTARLEGFAPEDLDAAYAAGAVARSTLLRMTIHAVSAEDYPTLYGTMHKRLRGARLGDPRFTKTGVPAAAALEALPELLEHLTVPRSKDEIDDWLGERLGVRHERVFWALRSFAPFWHVPNGGPWSFARGHAFRAAPEPMREPWEEAAAAALRRYLRAFGPATVKDFARFTLLTREMAREAVAAAGDTIVGYEGPDGSELFDVPGAPLPDGDTPAPPRLLPMWDSALMAHEVPGRLLDDGLRPLVVKRNGDVLPTVLLDGRVAGVWRPAERGVEVSAFRKLTRDEWDGLAAEAERLAPLAERGPLLHARFLNWWRGLEVAEVRLLPYATTSVR